ncbi:indoleamine 2, 3-dioxyganeseb [Moniliophthora roreri]|nr:indoleamine 2, 3-dioxyganeseb [Moniliophthora roreri]
MLSSLPPRRRSSGPLPLGSSTLHSRRTKNTSQKHIKNILLVTSAQTYPTLVKKTTHALGSGLRITEDEKQSPERRRLRVRETPTPNTSIESVSLPESSIFTYTRSQTSKDP